MRSTPGVARVISVLNFLAEHPQQDFTFTQISKSLRLSLATCHALLTGLVEGDYLYQNPDKTYVLGPAFLALGRSALHHFSPLAVARKEMRSLADSLDVVCAALFRQGDEVVALERAASVRHLGWAAAAAQPHPIYPWAGVLMTTLSETEVDDWMNKAEPPLTRQERRDTLRQIEFTRAHGYILAVRPEPAEPTKADVARTNRLRVRFLAELDPNGRYELAFVAAPVLNEEGKVAFALNLFGFDRVCGGGEVASIANQLREACLRISTFISGKRVAAGPRPHPVARM